MGALLDRSLAAALAVDEYVQARRAVAPAGELGGQLAHGLGGGLHEVAGLAGGGLGIAAGASASETARRRWQVVPPKTNLLVVTSQRVLLGRTVRGRYRATLADRPVGDVAQMEVVRAKVAFGKLRIHFDDGTSIELDLWSDRRLAPFVHAVEGAFPVVGS